MVLLPLCRQSTFAAIIALAIDHKGQQLIQMSIHLSTGAIVGIVSCIVTVFFTSIFIGKKNYRSGTVFAILLLVCDFCCDFQSDIFKLED